jgi:hypothetical protein
MAWIAAGATPAVRAAVIDDPDEADEDFGAS